MSQERLISCGESGWFEGCSKDHKLFTFVWKGKFCRKVASSFTSQLRFLKMSCDSNVATYYSTPTTKQSFCGITPDHYVNGWHLCLSERTVKCGQLLSERVPPTSADLNRPPLRQFMIVTNYVHIFIIFNYQGSHKCKK